MTSPFLLPSLTTLRRARHHAARSVVILPPILTAWPKGRPWGHHSHNLVSHREWCPSSRPSTTCHSVRNEENEEWHGEQPSHKVICGKKTGVDAVYLAVPLPFFPPFTRCEGNVVTQSTEGGNDMKDMLCLDYSFRAFISFPPHSLRVWPFTLRAHFPLREWWMSGEISEPGERSLLTGSLFTSKDTTVRPRCNRAYRRIGGGGRSGCKERLTFPFPFVHHQSHDLKEAAVRWV